jgi:hypothetical protein
MDKNIKIEYYINKDVINMENIEHMGIEFHNIQNKYKQSDDFITIGEDHIRINTWCAIFKGFGNSINSPEVSIPFYYEQFKELYDLLKIKMEMLDFYIPSFEQRCILINDNYSLDICPKYDQNLQTITKIYNKIQKKKILICNGYRRSGGPGQNFDQTIIEQLIDNHFFVKVTNENSIINQSLYQKYKQNILEQTNHEIMLGEKSLWFNNICASQSDIIIGLRSGLFITTFSKNTINKKFIFMSDIDTFIHPYFNVVYSMDNNEIVHICSD